MFGEQITFGHMILALAAQVVVLGGVVYALKKIMLGNTESAVNRLNRSYEEVDKKRSELMRKIKQIEEECDHQRESVQEEVKKMREDAEAELENKKEESIKEARQKAEHIINSALNTKKKIREDIKKEEQLKMISYCEQIIKVVFSTAAKESLNKLLIEESLERIKEVDFDRLPAGIGEIEFVLAQNLDSALSDKLKKIIFDKTDKNFNCKETIDKDILAGIIIKFGSLVLDESLASRIEAQALEMKTGVEER